MHRAPTMHRAHTIAALAVAAGLVLAGTCTEAAAKARSEVEREALVHAALAKSAYAGKRYDEAAKLFMKAYSKVPEPTLVYNAARSYQMAGRGKEALPLFRLYLQLEHHDDAQTAAGRQEAEQHIREIEAQLKAQQAEQERRRKELEARANKPPPTQPPPTQPPTQQPPTQQPPPQQPPAQQWPPPNQPPPNQPTGQGQGGSAMPPPAGMTPTGRKVVHRPDLFQRVSRITKPDAWSPQEKRAVVIGSIGAAALLTGLTLHFIETDLEALDDSARGKATVQGGRTFYPGITQVEMDDALGSHNAASYVGNTLIFGGLVAGGVATWVWLTAPHDMALQVSPSRGGAMVLATGRF